METQTNHRAASTEHEPLLLMGWLHALAMLCMAMGVLAAVTLGLDAYYAGRLGMQAGWYMAAAVIGGAVLAGILWAIGWSVRQQYRHVEVQRRILSSVNHLINVTPVPPSLHDSTATSSHKTLSPPRNGQPGLTPVAAVELLEQMRDLNVNLLLSDEQREKKRRYFLTPQALALAQEVARLAATGDVKPAWQALQRLARVAPDLPELERLHQQIQAAGKEAESRDIAQAQRWIRDFLAAGDFPAAESAANQVLAEYPQSQQAIELLARVRREKETLDHERRLKLFQKVEQEASARHWKAALDAAESFLQVYPATPEADNLILQLSTIRDNAAIEEAREMRKKIAELISQHHFIQALELSRFVVEKFPKTTAAQELHDGMAKLEERARLEEVTQAAERPQP